MNVHIGNDGILVYCPKCLVHRYSECASIPTQCPNPKCRKKYKNINLRLVACAHPDHNAFDGTCPNPDCFTHQKMPTIGELMEEAKKTIKKRNEKLS